MSMVAHRIQAGFAYQGQLLGGVNYDPGTAVSVATTSRTVMTAFDTTNARVTFTVPANGMVRVRIGVESALASNQPRILLGALSGASVACRVQPTLGGHSVSAVRGRYHADFVVPGLTPGASLTWDAAYSVDVLQASTSLNYGGPDNNSGGNAWGALQFEVWPAPSVLGAILYDPSSAGSVITTSLAAMTALDTTNLRTTIVAPGSGRVRWRMVVPQHGAATIPLLLLGVMESTVVVGRSTPAVAVHTNAAATSGVTEEATGIITGLTPGSSHVYDAAMAVQVVASAGGAVKWGGPNDTTTDNAFGGAIFEITAA